MLWRPGYRWNVETDGDMLYKDFKETQTDKTQKANPGNQFWKWMDRVDKA